MANTYFNNAIIGNSSMLGCLTEKGELIRLYWPNIDYPQHFEKFNAGIFFENCLNSTLWLNENNWRHSQGYIEDTNVLETVCEDHDKGLRVIQIDLVLHDKDVMIRHFEIQNNADHDRNIGFMLYSSGISTIHNLGSILFDFDCDALIHYRHGYYISISADLPVRQFQLGNNAYKSAQSTELIGCDSIGMMHDGALSWILGRIPEGGKKTINLILCASHTLKKVKELTMKIKASDLYLEYKNTFSYWKEFLDNSKYLDSLNKTGVIKNINIGKLDIIKLYKRSLLVFKLMWDKSTGGLLAAPEIDEEFRKCGRYAYCWGRDAAFITGALDKCGLTSAVDKFFEWALKTQDDCGVWHQRYYMDGNLAPSWGIQIDETGTLIWGMLEHYKVTKNMDFLINVWESVNKGVDFLIKFIDNETGLPRPSYDLWEERIGEHTYSSAAVYAGINAGAEIAKILKAKQETIDKWQMAAEKIKGAIEQNLWRENQGRFLRGIRTKLNPWGSEHSQNKVTMTVNPKGYCRDFTLEDNTVDVSLLGVAVPFGVFDVDDYRVRSTVNTIEKVLISPSVGGLKRYENDNYIGGNPWILTSLWVALYHIRAKNYERARSYFTWAVRSCTGLGLLPEQVNKDTGEPAWVIPLTWSHAMFVLVLTELLDAGEL